MPNEWALLPMQAVIVVFIERSDLDVPERVQLKMEIVAPSGEISPQATIEGAIDLTDNNKRARTTIQLPGLPVRAFGVHKFIMYLRQNPDDTWARISETPVEIKQDVNAIQTSALGQPKTPVKKSRRTKKAADQA